jgi:hypothetical protein
VRPGIAVTGVAAWNYSGPGGSVLRLRTPTKMPAEPYRRPRLFHRGPRARRPQFGTNIHGMFVDRTAYAKHEDGFRIEKCQVRFTGDGANLACVWCFSVRHCMLAYNKGDGMNLRGWDGFILDNWFSGNKGAGLPRAMRTPPSPSPPTASSGTAGEHAHHRRRRLPDHRQLFRPRRDRRHRACARARAAARRSASPATSSSAAASSPPLTPTIRRRSCWRAARGVTCVGNSHSGPAATTATPASGAPPTASCLPGPRELRDPRQRDPRRRAESS